ncbi:hypothetical protein TRFO_35778 [Tritrichomonas foetus]|uniref:DUF4201 domain-containing protein n=1 Tax=Tritrichomonas foetus TaxID=1144522 RepID=A0A1J4JFL3_9EUKA|nr:hypothetical protein TRFO_35778 [Tritrichomonas foetus]|eukprot:OHS97904.1 hypothetical protein TRFO_35778 [Tritrichomonas foetus]
MKKEYALLLKHLENSSNHFQQTVSIYKSKIKSLKQEIDSVATAKAFAITRLNSQHTKAINAARARHAKRLTRVREKYEEDILFNDEDDMNEGKGDKYLSSIDSTRAKIADVLNGKTEGNGNDIFIQHAKDKEQESTEKLNRVTAQIEKDRNRIKYLEEKIREVKADLEEARKIAQSQQTDLILSSPLKIDDSKRDEKLLYHSANAIAQENQYKTQAENQIEQIRAMLHQTRVKIDRYTQNVKNMKARSPPELEEALEELNDLEEEHKEMLRRKKMLSDMKSSIMRNKRRKKTIAEEIFFSTTALNEAQKENISLLEEIRRLDFMVYGRGGKYQTQKIANLIKANHSNNSLWSSI